MSLFSSYRVCSHLHLNRFHSVHFFKNLIIIRTPAHAPFPWTPLVRRHGCTKAVVTSAEWSGSANHCSADSTVQWSRFSPGSNDGGAGQGGGKRCTVEHSSLKPRVFSGRLFSGHFRLTCHSAHYNDLTLDMPRLNLSRKPQIPHWECRGGISTVGQSIFSCGVRSVQSEDSVLSVVHGAPEKYTPAERR